ncbi:MAG: DinB family protein [Gemmatimonadales bacterium]
MRRSLPGALLLLAALPGAAPAQAAAAIQPLFNSGKTNLIKSAELMPEGKYSFKPVATVRTFGELIGHLANENYLMCAAARGERNPADGKDFEKTTAKAELVKALGESLAYCDDAYRLPDARAMEQVEIFGMKGSRLWAITLNAIHNGEHYGNLVTYLRINGLVPPSSQQSSM